MSKNQSSLSSGQKFWIIWGKFTMVIFVLFILLFLYTNFKLSTPSDNEINLEHELTQNELFLQSIKQDSKKQEYVKASLADRGYDVLSVYLSNNSNFTETTASVDMKGLGSRNDQVWEGLLALEGAYPNATDFYVRILTEDKECYYSVNGNLFRDYLRTLTGEKIKLNNTEYNYIDFYEQIKYQIKNPKCYGEEGIY